MPTGFPSAPTTLTSFALISSLINKSFALIRNTPPIFALRFQCNKKIMRRDFPARHKSPRDRREKEYLPYAPCGTVRTESVLLHFPMYFITTFHRCQVFFWKNSKIFSFFFSAPRMLSASKNIFSSPWSVSTTRPTTFWIQLCSFRQFFEKNSWFFLLCIVFHENFDKKSCNLDIAFFWNSRYNNNAVGGTNSTASRTTVNCSCGISSLWYQRASLSTVVLF